MTSIIRGTIGLILALAGAVSAFAQFDAFFGDAERIEWRAQLAGDQQRLWLALTRSAPAEGEQQPIQTLLYTRTPTNEFGLPREMVRRVERVTPVRDGALLMFYNGSLYRADAAGDALSVQLQLPDRASPLDLVGTDPRGALAIIPSDIAVLLDPEYDAAAPLALARLSRNWNVVAPLPEAIRARAERPLAPRLTVTRDAVLLHALVDNAIRVYRLPTDATAWQPAGEIPAADIDGFWPLLVANTPTVLVARSAADEQTLTGYRLLGDAADPTDAWRAGDLQLSGLPTTDLTLTVRSAVGFNQQIVLLAKSADDDLYLRYARFGATPGESTTRVYDLLAPALTRRQTQRLFNVLSLVVLLLVLALLFAFRRSAMVTPVDLPANAALALVSQRMLGFLLDFIPFTVFAAYVHGLQWLDGMQAMLEWVFVSNPEEGLPPTKFLSWWLVSVLGYTAYAIVTEMILGRSFGKLLLRTRVIGETTIRAAWWQILLRNLARIIELLPPFAPLAILVILSRNRQRLGDIFARTVVVRLVPIDPRILELHRQEMQRRKQLAESDNAEAEQPPSDDDAPRDTTHTQTSADADSASEPSTAAPDHAAGQQPEADERRPQSPPPDAPPDATDTDAHDDQTRSEPPPNDDAREPDQDSKR